MQAFKRTDVNSLQLATERVQYIVIFFVVEPYQPKRRKQNSLFTFFFFFFSSLVETVVKADSRPVKSRRSPLQALYNGDQVRTQTPSYKTLVFDKYFKKYQF